MSGVSLQNRKINLKLSFAVIAPSKRMFLFAELALTLGQTVLAGFRKGTKMCFCHDFFIIIRSSWIFVIWRIGTSVDRQIKCHSTENMSKGLFLRPDLPITLMTVEVSFQEALYQWRFHISVWFTAIWKHKTIQLTNYKQNELRM